MSKERALRSRGSDSISNLYCNSCSWSVTVVYGKSNELSMQEVKDAFANHICSEEYGKQNAARNSKREDVN